MKYSGLSQVMQAPTSSCRFRVQRIDPLAGCRKRKLNQAASVLSFSLGFFWMCFVLFTRATFYVAFSCVRLCSVSWLFLLGCTSPSDRLERLISRVTCNVLIGTLNPTNSLTYFSHWKSRGKITEFVLVRTLSGGVSYWRPRAHQFDSRCSLQATWNKLLTQPPTPPGIIIIIYHHQPHGL